MSDLNQVMIAEITKNLPAMVGNELKEVLTKAIKDAELAATIPKLNESIQELRETIKRHDDNVRMLDGREDDLNKGYEVLRIEEAKQAIARAVLAEREKSMAAQLAYSKEVLGTIFRDRQVTGYMLNGSIPINTGNGYSSSQPFTASVTPVPQA